MLMTRHFRAQNETNTQSITLTRSPYKDIGGDNIVMMVSIIMIILALQQRKIGA